MSVTAITYTTTSSPTSELQIRFQFHRHNPDNSFFAAHLNEEELKDFKTVKMSSNEIIDGAFVGQQNLKKRTYDAIGRVSSPS